jgi:hypothetical protein
MPLKYAALKKKNCHKTCKNFNKKSVKIYFKLKKFQDNGSGIYFEKEASNSLTNQKGDKK